MHRFLLSLALISTLNGQVPHLLNYQGRITAAGVNWDGAGQFKFALVNEGGTQAYWMNSPDLSPADGEPDSPLTLQVNKGLYSVALGDTAIPGMAAIPPSVFANAPVYLRVWFNDNVHGWERLAPDQRFAAVAYAMMAEGVPDGSITTAKLAAGAVTSDRIAPGAITGDRIAPGAITADLIAEGAITAESIGAETPESAQARVDALGASMAGGMNALKAMLGEGRRDAAIHVISDSTNANGAWSQYVAKSIGALYPKYTVKTTSWIPAGANWTPPVTVQTGTADGGSERRWEFPPATTFTPINYGTDYPMPSGDVDIRVRVRIDNASAVSNTLFSKWSEPNGRSFFLAQESAANSRKLLLSYSVDGSAIFNIQSSVGLGENGISDGTPYWARVTVDIDNGSGGKAFNFYTSLDGATWTPLGSTITSAATGIQPLSNSINSCSLGGTNGTAKLVGAVYAAELRAGINGPVVHPMNLDAWFFNEGPVNLVGAPQLWVTNAAYSGASVDTFLALPDSYYCRNHSPQIILVSLSHNSLRETGNRFITKMKTLVSKIRGVYGDIPRIIFLTQNPQIRIPYWVDPNGLHEDARVAHRAQFMAWASGAGYGVIDTWAAFENDPRPLEYLVGTNTWSNLPITGWSSNGTTVTVNVGDMQYLGDPALSRLAILDAKHPDGSSSRFNGAYPMTGRSPNTAGPGWVQFSSTLTDPIMPGVGTVGPCDGVHPSIPGYKLWAEVIMSAFRRGVP
ncbi:SGNH/GDSL hydrolase family protein [Luteolibacter luteus]|uniref:Uncharacterized protein n=1 Tax=Luteolibacter luteus TaxID=2728835 RepID=A0A858RR45_9BACT|nr:hypothetical protein [Luteolibacter luteus]QJE98858.1 hypothetical protein HHL09_24780 [Luteolibacter luteus]